MQDWEGRRQTAADHVVPFLLRTARLHDARVLEFGTGNGAIACALTPRAGLLRHLDVPPGEPSTLYTEVPLPPGSERVTLTATLPGEISFAGLRRP